jgi:hypothetical protein
MQIETYACGKCKNTSLYKDVNIGGPVYIACRICGNRWPGAGAKPVKVTKDDMGTVTGVFVDGEPIDTGEDDDEDADGGVSELEEAFPDREPPASVGVRTGVDRVSQITAAEVVRRKYTKATSLKKVEAPKKAQGSATREKNLAARKELVAVALREGDGLKEVRARCHVGKVTVYEVLKGLLEEGEVLKCRCGREAMHRGGCKKPANQVSSSYSKPADVVPTVILQQKPTVDKIIPSEKKEISPGTITALKAEIRSRYEAKIAGLKTKMDMVLSALDELIDW